MILYRRGFGLFEQEELAKNLKIKIDKNSLECYNITLDTYTNPEDAGMKTTESEGIINKFFKSKNIGLSAKGVRVSEIQNLEEFLFDNINKNNDIWMEWMIYKIFNEKQHKEKFYMPEWMSCHDSVIESVIKNKQSAKTVIVDPFWYHKPRMEIDVEKLRNAIIGFIVISKK